MRAYLNPASDKEIVSLATRYHFFGFEDESVPTEEELAQEDAYSVAHQNLVAALDSRTEAIGDLAPPETEKGLAQLALIWRRAEQIEQLEDPTLANTPAWETANKAYNTFIDALEEMLDLDENTL